ncbi:hypothetical protein DFH07DRAFT_856379 [Mycena maculata]|uniref:Uncharacterized protein n=1 Tax=Mycena maculata TaxID=230809 RepID=A0AAD7MLL5_9AGAR|nr:hypothetical protein DFH07DRAFT_856379 [Mycena maculata]
MCRWDRRRHRSHPVGILRVRMVCVFIQLRLSTVRVLLQPMPRKLCICRPQTLKICVASSRSCDWEPPGPRDPARAQILAIFQPRASQCAAESR